MIRAEELATKLDEIIESRLATIYDDELRQAAARLRSMEEALTALVKVYGDVAFKIGSTMGGAPLRITHAEMIAGDEVLQQARAALLQGEQG